MEIKTNFVSNSGRAVSYDQSQDLSDKHETKAEREMNEKHEDIDEALQGLCA